MFGSVAVLPLSPCRALCTTLKSLLFSSQLLSFSVMGRLYTHFPPMSRGKMKKVFAVFRVLTFPPYGWDFLKKIFSAGEKQAQSVVLHPVGNGKKAVPPAASAAVPNAPIHSERKYQFSGVPIRLDEWGRNGCMPFRKTQSTQTERHEVVISPHCSGTMGTPQYLILALLGRRYSSPFGTTQRSLFHPIVQAQWGPHSI